MTWNILPVVVYVKRRGWPPIWLPLILLWPVIIAVFCMALPVCLLVPALRRSAFEPLVASYRVLCALHGTDVELGARAQSTWTFSIY
jgi:fatty acid desaturase